MKQKMMENILFEEEIEIGGIRLPKKEVGTTPDQSYLGTDHLAKQNMDL